MSIALIKSIFEGQDIKSLSNLNIGLEFNKKFLNYSLVKKLCENNQNRKILVLNFDIFFHKYIIGTNNNDIKIYNGKTLGEGGVKDNTAMINLYSCGGLILEKLVSYKPYLIVICGLDLLSESIIHSFFKKNQNFLNNAAFNIYLSSLDDSFINLNDDVEKKRNIIRSKLNIYISEKASKLFNNKLLIYSEFVNFNKLTKDIGIIEYNIDLSTNFPVYINKFEKINIYMKEYKDIFETPSESGDGSTKTVEQPTSTFKLTLNEKELAAKNEVILPYLNKDKQATITIDQDDLNELYEEDPDGDLDI
jgi:hypothetical protein